MTLPIAGPALLLSRPAHAAAMLAFGLCVCLAAGCREQEQITTVVEPRGTGLLETAPAVTVPGRLVGVLLDHGADTWFFKVLGPDDAVRRQVTQIKALLVGLTFEGNKPRWTLPEGWHVGRNTPERFATIVMEDSKPPLELAISKFPGGQNVPDNVNRWRKQLGLSEVAADEALKSVVELPTASGPAKFVELTGTFSADSNTMRPFAGFAAQDKPAAKGALPAGHPPVDAAAGALKAPAAGMHAPSTGPVRYQAPSDWEPVAASKITLAAFAVADAGQTLRITVSEAQGDLLSNINRWRGQELGLPPIDADKLQSNVTKLKVDGRDADFVELVGSANPGPQQAIFVVVVPDGKGSSWFLKLKGDAPLAQRRRDEFSRFVASFRIVSE